jgi:hypothetical protein
MTHRETRLIYLLAGLMFAIMLGLATAADASGKHDHDINLTINNYQEPVDVQPLSAPMTITSGVSDTALAAGIATAMASGGHQFDYSTTDFQGSINAAFQATGSNENNVSFALGKRWKSMDALFHASYTPDTENDDDWFTVGGTFRF